uniref:Uncharacterized protein n=1 Tax=Stomoxys calcitrans TaxID=35570 RepID=A0A1I8PP84_STOCA
MKHPLLLLAALMLIFSALSTKADLLECDDSVLPSISDMPIIGPKITSEEDNRSSKVKDVIKEWSCKFKKTTANIGDNVREKTKQWAEGIRESFKKLKEKSKDLHKKFETKYQDFKDRLNKDSGEFVEIKEKKLFFKPDDLIKVDTLKIYASVECGHGHILDALGNCKKLKDYDGMK